jgi:collagenase-like PrtC family protease
LICNLICRKHCPFQAQHANFHSHASQTKHVNKRLPLDYYCIYCLARNFSTPEDIVRAQWIRPEDLELYENIGIEHFKLAERGMNTDDLALIVNAYTQRSYDGNFMDLIPSMSKYEYITHPSTGHFMKYLGQFRKVRLKTVRKSLKAVMALKDMSAFYKDLGIYIDNKALDGFAKYFTTHQCRETVCEECSYCDKWAKKVVQIKDEKQREHAVDVFENILSTLTSDALY